MMRFARELTIAVGLWSSTVLAPLPGHAGERGDATAAAHIDCTATRVGEITVATIDNVPIVTLIADGVPVVLILDTGAARTIFTQTAAHRIGAPPPRVEFDRRIAGIASDLPIREVELRRFSIGGVDIPWHRIAVAPTALPRISLGPLDGMLGADVLGAFDVDLDLPHHRMILHEQSSCPISSPDWGEPFVAVDTGRSRGDKLFFPVRLDSKPFFAIVDTGAKTTTLSSTAARRLGIGQAEVANDRSETLHGAAGEQIAGHLHRFQLLEVAGEAIRDPEIVVADVNVRDDDIILGIDFALSRRLWFSYGSRRIFLSRARSQSR